MLKIILQSTSYDQAFYIRFCNGIDENFQNHFVITHNQSHGWHENFTTASENVSNLPNGVGIVLKILRRQKMFTGYCRDKSKTIMEFRFHRCDSRRNIGKYVLILKHD